MEKFSEKFSEDFRPILLKNLKNLWPAFLGSQDSKDHLIPHILEKDDKGNYSVKLREDNCQSNEGTVFDSPKVSISQKNTSLENEPFVKTGTVCIIDGSVFRDIPTIYKIEGIFPHELPVVGTFVHPDIIIGLSYVVRPLDGNGLLFQGKALRLLRVGNSYGKRLTFEGDSHLTNENYFWSDTNPAGYGFTLEVIHVGDHFTMIDSDQIAIGSVEVKSLMYPQYETEESRKNGSTSEKQVYVAIQCVVTTESSRKATKNACISGVAIVKKNKPKSMYTISKVRDCKMDTSGIFTLVPTELLSPNRTFSSFSGMENHDIPIDVQIEDLLPEELPVKGPYVNSKITPGSRYRVRYLGSNNFLFNGHALQLLSIGRGYGKRITFAGGLLTENDNYFWSDSSSGGYGFSLEVVSEGDWFSILDCNNCEIGSAVVFKLNGPQIEVQNEYIEEERLIRKRISLQITCHLSSPKGLFNDATTRINGCAIVECKKGSPSQVKKIEHLSLPYAFCDELRMIEKCSLQYNKKTAFNNWSSIYG